MKISTLALPLLAIAIGFSIAASQATADWIETFDGGFDQTWTFFDNDGNIPPSDTTVSTAGDKLSLTGVLSATPDLSVAGLVFGESFSDVKVRANVTPGMGFDSGGPALSNNDVFVAARSNGVEAYLLALDWLDGRVDLVRVDDMGMPVGLSDIENPSWFVAGETYQLELRVLGDELRGRIFDAGGNLLDSLTTNDSTLASGTSGLGASINNTWRSPRHS